MKTYVPIQVSTWMLKAAISIIAKHGNSLNVHQLVNHRTNNMEYYLAIKRKDVLIHAMTGMTLENVMLKERSQSQNNIIYCMIAFI